MEREEKEKDASQQLQDTPTMTSNTEKEEDPSQQLQVTPTIISHMEREEREEDASQQLQATPIISSNTEAEEEDVSQQLQATTTISNMEREEKEKDASQRLQATPTITSNAIKEEDVSQQPQITPTIISNTEREKNEENASQKLQTTPTTTSNEQRSDALHEMGKSHKNSPNKLDPDNNNKNKLRALSRRHHATPTKASKNQRWDVYHEMEESRKNPNWSRVDPKDKLYTEFHRLNKTPTKASNSQRWDVFNKMEKSRKNNLSITIYKNDKQSKQNHRLHDTPTKASNSQRWDVFNEMEKSRKNSLSICVYQNDKLFTRFHRLYDSPTEASKFQRWDVFHNMEKKQKNIMNKWSDCVHEKDKLITQNHRSFHRLHNTPTKASQNQRLDVFLEMEKTRKNPIKNWGVDEKNKLYTQKIAGIRHSPIKTRTPLNTKGRGKRLTPLSTQTYSRSPITCISSPRKDYNADKNYFRRKFVRPENISKLKTQKIKFPDEEEMDKIFRDMDSNNTKNISLAEIDKTVMILYPDFHKKSTLSAAYKCCDTLSDGLINRKEFDFFFHYLVYYNNLWSLFSLIENKECDGRITRDEFIKASKLIDSSKDPNDLFNAIDMDGSGRFLFNDFYNYLAITKSEIGLDDEKLEEQMKKYSDKKKAGQKFTARDYRSMNKIVRPDDISKLKTSKIELPDEGRREKIFRETDNNDSGRISLAGIDKTVLILYPDLYKKPALLAAYKCCDTHSNGLIDRKEFEFFFHYLVYYNNLWSFFSMIDEEGDGRVNWDAAKIVNSSKDQYNLFDAIDEDGSGRFLFDDFCNYLAATKSEIGLDEEKLEEQMKKYSDEKKAAKKFTASDYQSENKIIRPSDISMFQTSKMKFPEEGEREKIFRDMDSNGSGKLTLLEIEKTVLDVYPNLHNKQVISVAYGSCNTSADGFIDQEGFEFFFHYLAYYDNLWSLFSAINEEGDGQITRDEFMKASKLVDSDKDSNNLFDEIDVNKSGKLLFNDFCNYLATSNSRIGMNDENKSEEQNKNFLMTVKPERGSLISLL